MSAATRDGASAAGATRIDKDYIACARGPTGIARCNGVAVPSDPRGGRDA